MKKRLIFAFLCGINLTYAMYVPQSYTFDSGDMKQRIVLARNARELAPIVLDLCRLTMFLAMHISFDIWSDSCRFDGEYALTEELHAKLHEYVKDYIRPKQARKKLWLFLIGSLVLDFKNAAKNALLCEFKKREARAVAILFHFFTDIGYQPLDERKINQPFELPADRKYMFAIVDLCAQHLPVMTEMMDGFEYTKIDLSGKITQFEEYQKTPSCCVKLPPCYVYFQWFDDFWNGADGDYILSEDGAVRYYREALSLIESVDIAKRSKVVARK